MNKTNGDPLTTIFGKKIFLFPLVLFVVIFLRGVSLEYGDLVDPTETRYATIAQNMVISGDWVTPRLPTEKGLEPYLSKPPLHYWLTVLTQELFGIDEWSARFPSYLGLLLIIGSILVFSKKFFNKEIGYIASIVCVTSPLMFVLSGSSTVDVTFAAFVSAALVAFAVSVRRKEEQQRVMFTGLLFFLFCGLAFLTKGPAGLILIGLPIFILCCYDKGLSSLKGLPWISGTLLFLVVVIPWFYFIEKSVPGSVWYFFVHENFLRFLVKEYGGKHGEAHIQPYGSIWWMLIVSTLPWSLFLIRDLFSRIRNFKTSKRFRPDRWLLFSLACGFSPIVFFTFARSILPAYVLPAIPGLAVYLGYLVYQALPISTSIRSKEGLFAKLFSNSHHPCSAKLGIGMITLMIVGLYFVAPIVEVKKSASTILEVVADNTKRDNLVVGTISVNNYSPFWTSGASAEELSKPINVEYANPEAVKTTKYRHLVIRDKGKDDFLAQHGERYERVQTRGYWTWYRRRHLKTREER